jgi:hypothetical protein
VVGSNVSVKLSPSSGLISTFKKKKKAAYRPKGNNIILSAVETPHVLTTCYFNTLKKSRYYTLHLL